MKKFVFIFGALAFFHTLHAQDAEPTTIARNQIRTFLLETEDLYAAEDPEALAKAAARFRALLEQTPEGELNPDALKLAEGMAKLKAEDAEGSLKLLDEIEGFEDPQIRGQLRQMKGNAQMKLAESAWAAQDWENAKKGMGDALESFTNALRENPEMDAARNNLELAHKKLIEIKEQEPPPPENQEEQEKKDQEEKKKEEQKDQSKQDPSGQQDPSEQNNQQKQDPSKQQDQGNQEDQSEKSREQEDQPKENQDGQAEEKDPTNSEEEPGQAGEAGEMTDAEKLDAMQARQLLDAALEQEKAQRHLIQQQRVRVIPVEKDW